MTTSSLYDLCTQHVTRHFLKFNIDEIKVLPFPLRQSLICSLSPLNLRRLEIALGTPTNDHQNIWRCHYAKNFSIYYRRMFKVTEANDNVFCAVSRESTDYRAKFMEDHFHILLEDANKIAILLERGVNVVNVYKDDEVASGNEKVSCHVKMDEIKSDMFLCAPFVTCLRIFRTKVLMSSLLREVVDILTQSVICLRLVFLHDYRLLRETIDYFITHANILDLHTVWQPQRSSLPASNSVEILSMLAGLQLPQVADIEEEEVNRAADAVDESVVWNAYDLYDIAISGARIDLQCDDNILFECAAVQSDRAATHISISSSLLTQQQSVHKFIANTIMDRWISLTSFKLSCQSHIDIEIFLPALLKLVRYHNLRSLCFEDTQFQNPMNLFRELLTILMENEEIVMKRVTMLGAGHPFSGDFSSQLITAGQFHAIAELDLSFSSLSQTNSMATFYEYISRDKALRSLNLNCCKLPPDESTATILQAIGLSGIRELVMDFNQITGLLVEDAMIDMLHNNDGFETLSCSLCGFSPVYLRNRLLPALARLPKLDKLYLAENKIGCEPALKDLIVSLLNSRQHMGYLDLSSNLLTGDFLCEILNSILKARGQRVLFKGLNISFNLDRGDRSNTEYIRDHFTPLCEHFLCMILYEDHANMARLEHLAEA